MARAQASEITLREVAPLVALPLLADLEAFDTTKGADTVESIVMAGRCFVIEQGGRDIAAYVLQLQGRECYVLAYAGEAGFDLTAFLAAALEGHAKGLDSIAFQTCRAGLIRKAKRYGYRIDGQVARGVVMRKELK